MNGISSKAFAPTNNITVEQMSVMVSNCISKLSLSPKAAPVVYSDMSSVSTWAVSGVEAMAKYNLIPVDAASNINPHKQATRSECTVSLVRLAQSTGMGVAPNVDAGDGWVTDYSYYDLYREDPAVVAKISSIHDELWTSGAIKSGMTEKEKAIAYFRWMCENTRYGSNVGPYDSEDGITMEYHSSYGPLILGKGVCDGLSYAYRHLLATEGIYCRTILSEERNHAWNVVTLDGKEYEIDTTLLECTKWADGSLSEVAFANTVQKLFYPDEWQAEQDKNSGFDKVSEEDLQRMLDEMQAEYNASWNQ